MTAFSKKSNQDLDDTNPFSPEGYGNPEKMLKEIATYRDDYFLAAKKIIDYLPEDEWTRLWSAAWDAANAADDEVTQFTDSFWWWMLYICQRAEQCSPLGGSLGGLQTLDLLTVEKFPHPGYLIKLREFQARIEQERKQDHQ